MIIANPIYDTTFRPFMKNERMAKFFIGALLGQTVVSLERSPKEYIYKKITPEEDSKPKRFGYSISFFNFAAIILTETGEQKKILIEVHKTWDKHDLWFYREYVDEHYRRVYEINGEEVFLPIIDVYLLNFNLPEIESACVKIEHGGYRDMRSNMFVEAKSRYLGKLQCDSIVIQAKRITSDRYQTDPDKLLSLFEQADFPYDTEIVKMYNHPIDNEVIKEIIDMLHYAGTEPDDRKQLEIEHEAIRTFKVCVAERNTNLDEQDKLIEEMDKVIEEKDKAIAAIKRQLEEIQRR